MKIKITEIEASAEDLRQSNSLSDGLTRMMRNVFTPYFFDRYDNDECEQTERSE